MKLRRITALFLLLASIVSLHGEDTAEILAKARARIGSEAALEAIRSIHFFGEINTEEPTAAGGLEPVVIPIEIIFQKPLHQLQIITHAKKNHIVTTALNEREAWSAQARINDPSQRVLRILPLAQQRSLQAATWENLHFFKGIEAIGGRIEDLGTDTIDGVACRRLAFVHPHNSRFVRYFDAATGKLVLSVIGTSDFIREEGEITVGGLRFPQKLVTRKKAPDGKELITTVTFQKIVLNEPLPPERFVAPIIP